MSTYGYLHTARVVSQDEAGGGWYVQSVALARDRKWGPIPSCVIGLQPGDKVVLAATGTTRDNLMILGALDPRYPDLDDIPGLAEALAAKADQAALDAFEDATNLNFLVVNNKNDDQDGRLDTQDSRLDTLDAADVSLDGRLDTAETAILSHTGTLASQAGTLVSHETELGLLQEYMRPAYDSDNYGDLMSSITRREASNSMTLTTNAVYFVKLRAHTALPNVARIRWAFNNVAVGAGSVVGGLYTASSSAGPFSLVKSTANVAATAINLYNVAWSDASTVTIARGTWVLLALLCNSGYTQNPRLATQQNVAAATTLLHPSGSAATVIGMKVGAPLPATINPNDGTWTPLNLNPWLAIAA